MASKALEIEITFDQFPNVIKQKQITQDGRLEVNDQLIEVNGNSLLGISNEQALNVLKTCMMIENSSVIQVKKI